MSDASDPDELDICVGRVRRVPTINKTTDLFALLQPIGRRVAPVARIVKWLFSRKYWFPSCIRSDQILNGIICLSFSFVPIAYI